MYETFAHNRNGYYNIIMVKIYYYLYVNDNFIRHRLSGTTVLIIGPSKPIIISLYHSLHHKQFGGNDDRRFGIERIFYDIVLLSHLLYPIIISQSVCVDDWVVKFSSVPRTAQPSTTRVEEYSYIIINIITILCYVRYR